MKYALHLSTPLIAAALVIDLVMGDPTWMPSPVRLIGALIGWGDRRLHTGYARLDLRNGRLLALGVIALTALATWAIVAAATSIGYAAGAAVAVVMAWTTLAMRGLDDAAAEVGRALADGDDRAARRALPALVGRDPEQLDRHGIIRATVESVAENCSDGVVAPLFYLFLGGPVAGMAYKAANTLDSMIGHRSERYLFFGRAAARIDDVANYLPARITALCLVAAAEILSARGARAFTAVRADARRHPSPNAGYPEAAMAGALGIQLGGDTVYDGEPEHRPLLGEPELPPAVDDIAEARSLMRIASTSAFCLFAIARFIVENW